MSKFEDLCAKHPCYSKGPQKTGRIHLPVSPGCNIGCKFCDRKVNDFEQRPGVTGQIITPKEALEVVRRALEVGRNITVAGIAGPGDTLATPYALETFRLIKKEFPQLFLCMSTNGLLLPEKADEIIRTLLFIFSLQSFQNSVISDNTGHPASLSDNTIIHYFSGFVNRITQKTALFCVSRVTLQKIKKTCIDKDSRGGYNGLRQQI